MDFYNFAFLFFAYLLPLSKPLYSSVAENINLLLYLLDLCPLDFVAGSGLRHWTQWMHLQRTKGSSGLLAPRAGIWCYPSCGSSAGLSAGAITFGLSLWLGFLMIWQLSSVRECPKNKSFKTLRLLMTQTGVILSLPPHSAGQSNSQAQNRFRNRWNRLCLPIGVLHSTVVLFNQTLCWNYFCFSHMEQTLISPQGP